ncbi:5-oxoprolinase subunit PxpB [Paenibacillus xylaniclasticus]|uniref:5-oxoprolinase subunit PxpB n=1 Tax=Paenibacillus xylaniclasticus TaxID=588083 RepID=UPI000FDA5803|nr:MULTISPECIES: 5-oxoprolinase subunit PxpB [Paenibacillus]GFN31115.1 allophanate hydrolase [Paenibacillus curdlanolyticus]
MKWNLSPLGDRALVAELQSGQQCSDEWITIAQAAERIRRAGLLWVVDVIPAYSTVTVVYEPMRLWGSSETAFMAAKRELSSLLSAPAADWKNEARELRIPVCYGGERGPDLAACAARSGVSEADFVRMHAEVSYQVALVGFVPGFPYLAGLPQRLAQPRHDSPRARVPAGSVGIAGGQTGIYPLTVPGGWQLIGRTPLRLFDAVRREPAMLRAGDRVVFIPIDEEQYRHIEEELAAAANKAAADGSGNKRGGECE